MAMQIGIVFGSEQEKKSILSMRCQINAFREDQVEHFENLLRSWRIFHRGDCLSLINKAIRRTLRDRP